MCKLIEETIRIARLANLSDDQLIAISDELDVDALVDFVKAETERQIAEIQADLREEREEREYLRRTEISADDPRYASTVL